MANLRLLAIKVIDSTTIKARFTDNLDPLIGTSNIEIISNIPEIPNPQVLTVSITGPNIALTTQPMTPYAGYFIEFKSTDSASFKSKNGSSFLLEDGVTNKPLIIGPEDPANPIRDNLIGYLQNNVYNIDSGTLVKDILNSQADLLAKALYHIKEAKNDNYVSVLIEDEKKVRGAGPFDRLNEEGAYQVIRVGKTLTGTTTDTSLSFDSFPEDPVTLLSATITEEELTASNTESSSFNGLILTVSKNFVIKLTSVIINYQNGSSAEYDVNLYGYQILEPKYDTAHASPLFTLESNQFKLSDTILDTDFILPVAGDTVVVTYDFQQKGRVIDSESVVVSQVLEAVREITPPISTQFTLDHSPVVSDLDILVTQDGVEFLDPEANPPFSDIHPAFITEVPFRFEGLPNQPGEFAIDYETGRVFCYGAEDNDGTGKFPPVANYKYRRTFNSRLDYTYDPDFVELVANPLRSLIGETAKISFSYEQTLVPDVDYKAQIHTEVLDERIENRLNNNSSITVNKTPITNVFRVYNETSGEIYNVIRWTDTNIVFSSTNSPRIIDASRERVSFTNIDNELILVGNEFTNILGTKVYQCSLENNRIISATEDAIGSSFNSSVSFSRNDLFTMELYFDGQILSVTENTDRLNIGQYQIDYSNGVVYVGVSADQNFDLGTINYKSPFISPQNSHVLSVSEVYHSISNILGVAKRLEFTDFGEGYITPTNFDVVDERFLGGDTTLPYIVSDGTITVTDDIKEIRGIFDAYDLNNNAIPTNFASGATFNANVISLNSIEKQESAIIQSGNVLNMTNITAGAEISEVISVIRDSDGLDLWTASPGSINGYDITLSGINSPAPGESVVVIYNLSLNGAATPIIDYDRGEYFADYSYLADEILVSYEYGDNCLDFRESEAVDKGEEYYVTYRVGALRTALLQNFGSLIDIPIMTNFDTALPRENYRDAIKAALQSFTKGPTIPAIKAVVSNITHIDPEITEAIFQNWSLGVSRLYPSDISYTGDFQLVPGKFDYGALLNSSGQTISFPVSSNLRLAEGSLETWVFPEWAGLDNDATLTFSGLELNGSPLSVTQIFIGSDSHNPTYTDNNEFTVNRADDSSPIGLPSAIFTEPTGMFIYYDEDVKQWKVYAKNSVTGADQVYSGTITSSGEVYHVKNIPGLGELNDVLRSFQNKIEFTFNIDAEDAAEPDGYVDGYNIFDGYTPGDGYVDGYSFDGFGFMADNEHYLFDFGKTESSNRFSLYKDGRGYLNFRVHDNGQGKQINQFKVSADISNWAAGEAHHVGISWKLNTSDRRDEMHLFIDGEEVPNILRFGGRPISTSSDRFRTVKPEYVVGTATKKAILGNDLQTLAGSNLVFSDSINFQAEGIIVGDELDLLETGFGSYTILAVSNNILTLDAIITATFTDARFAVNKYSSVVTSEIDLASNIAVSVIRDGEETELPGLRADFPAYTLDKNNLNQNILVVLGNLEVGDQVVVRTLGLNHRRARDRKYIWGNTTNIFKTQLPPPINLDEVKIVPVILPWVPIGPDNSVYTLGNFVATLTPTSVSNSSEGRTLSVRLGGGNTTFPAAVVINGTSSGPVSETLTFTAAGTQTTANKWKTISSVVVTIQPIVSTKNAGGIEIKEAYPITYPEGNETYAVIRFSYQTQLGSNLSGTSGGTTVQDLEGVFFESNIDQLLVISSPAPVAGTYTITDRTDNNNISISPALPASFTGGTYAIFNTTIGRSGFQNGYFLIEEAGGVNVPFPLPQGLYELDYSAYLEVPFDSVGNWQAFVGSDINGENQANAILDELRILNYQMTDIRIGETANDSQDYFTTDALAIRPFKSNSNTLMLLHFDELPLINSADYWTASEKNYLQSGGSVNDNFGQSLVVTNKPLVVDNAGLLSTSSEGTIEFWVSPRYDTYNDPNFRFYFDASGSIVEETTSLTNGSIKLSNRVSSVQSVRLITDTQNTGADYFTSGGSIEPDFQTIRLRKPLPHQQTPVKVQYIPSGLVGNRLSIYKDQEGFITFNVRTGENDFQVRQPVFWSRDSWHRIRATFKFNRSDNQDEIRLFVDGEERGVVRFGQGLLFGQGIIFGQGFSGVDNTVLTGDINFSDPINQFYIGSDFLSTNPAQARIDNLKISNISRSPTVVGSQPKDVNFSSNLNVVYPSVEDVYTLYLLNFDSLLTKIDDFTLLKSEKFGIFDFTLDIIDSFGIVSGNAKVKQILETLISTLKPAPSRATLNYID